MLKTALLTTTLLATSAAQGATYPDLPTGIKNGVGGLIGDTVYVGLGTAGQHFYALDLNAAPRQWREVAPFPDAPRDQAASAVLAGRLYVFGGTGKPTPDAPTAVFNQVHAYDPATNTWTVLPTRAPVDVAGGVATTVGDRILLLGGVNRNIFDGYFRDLAAAGTDKARADATARAYFEQRAQDYFFNKDVQAYAPATNTWQSAGVLPFAGRAGAALITEGPRLTVINGEIKPGLRSPTVQQGTAGTGPLTWQALPDLPAPPTADTQDGLAGAFAGLSHGALLVMGGANFPGAAARYAAGHLYAHEGLTKTWHSDIYAYHGGQWHVVGQLPQAQGYGLTIQRGDELILVGGELQGGAASTTVFSVELTGAPLTIRD